MTDEGRWGVRFRFVLTHPIRAAYRVATAVSDWVSTGIYRLLAAVLFRWGHRLKVPGNLRHRIYWRARRRDIVPLHQLYDFMSQEQPHGQYYAVPRPQSVRSQTILNALGSRISQDDSFLEIGCNTGRNLNHLWQAGFRRLYGMEISAHAVERMRVEYPGLAQVTVEVGPAESSIRHHAAKSIDVIFTMATLEHLHPQCRSLFADIARVARKYVLAIEPRDGHRSHMQYPWDVAGEFTHVGLTLIESKPWSALWPGDLTPANEWADDMHAFQAYLFKVP